MSKHRAAKAPPSRATVRRKPQSICINLTNDALRALLIEQSRDGDDYITVYRGSRTEFNAAGVPEAAFSPAGKGRKFQIKPTWPRDTILEGATNPIDEGFELEVGWGRIAPSPCGCGHPAITELARIMMIEVSDWAGSRPWPAGLKRPPNAPPDTSSLWHMFEKLAQDEWAEGYKPGADSPRLRISAEFREKIWAYAHGLYQDIQRECEVFADTRAPREGRYGPERPALRLAVDNTRG